jgi:hypothetical protein
MSALAHRRAGDRSGDPFAQTALDSSIYQVRVQRATEAERQYTRAMAELGPGPHRSGSVARQAGKSTAALSQIRQRLLDKGLIYATEDYGHVDFTIPRFDEFMRRHAVWSIVRATAAELAVRVGLEGRLALRPRLGRRLALRSLVVASERGAHRR